ncbi:hypothetical protein OROGR_004507 [Orobanche gracilis]
MVIFLQGDRADGVQILRPLKLDDFIHSKAKVGPSVAYDAASMNELRKWKDQYGEGGSRRKSPFGFSIWFLILQSTQILNENRPTQQLAISV